MDVGLVVADPNNLTTHEAFFNALIDGHAEHSVTLVEFGQAPSGVDVAVVCDMTDEGTSEADYSPYRDTGVGVVQIGADETAVAGLRLGAARNLRGVRRIEIVDDSHPLAGGLTGSPAIYDSNQTIFGIVESGLTVDAAQVGLTTAQTDEWAIVGYEAGDTGTDSFVFPARRSYLGVAHRDRDYGEWTANGDTLLFAHIEWAGESTGQLPGPDNVTLEPGWDDSTEQHYKTIEHDLVHGADTYRYSRLDIEAEQLDPTEVNDSHFPLAVPVGTGLPPFVDQPLDEHKPYAYWVESGVGV